MIDTLTLREVFQVLIWAVLVIAPIALVWSPIQEDRNDYVILAMLVQIAYGIFAYKSGGK